MGRFRYRAYDAKGALKIAEVEAASEAAALSRLNTEGLFPIDISDARGAPPSPLPWWQRELAGGSGLSRRHQALLVRELAALVAADVPVDEALRILALQPMSAHARRAVSAMLEHVSAGAALSEAMAVREARFPSAVIGVVQAGEASGTLGSALVDLAAFLDRGEEIRAKVRGAMVYPALLLVTAMATLVVLATVLVPSLAPIFDEAKTDPPAAIAWLLGLRRTVEAHWAQLLAAGALLAALVLMGWQSAPLRRFLDRVLLALPIAGPLIAAGEAARLLRTLGTLLKGGVAMLQALSITAGAMRTAPFRAAVGALEEGVRQGRPLASLLGEAPRVPPLAARLAGVGEETGQLDAMLLKGAQILEAGQISRIERLTSLLTPLLTLVIGVAVGGLILAVIDAILSINELVLR
jgi:general secretion pathway protein F